MNSKFVNSAKGLDSASRKIPQGISSLSFLLVGEINKIASQKIIRVNAAELPYPPISKRYVKHSQQPTFTLASVQVLLRLAINTNLNP